jgi:pyridoxal phosphate enzyme (YggS family)
LNSIAQNLKQIQQRIKDAAMGVGRNPQNISLLAVSKTRTVEEVIRALEAGQKNFGENYLDDAMGKIQHIGNQAVWHFIGPVQSNKTRDIAQYFDWVHSIDRIKIATRLNDQRPDSLAPLKVCLQVNTSAESTKSGVSPKELLLLAEEVNTLPNLELCGLMTIPTAEDDVEKQKVPFKLLNQLQQKLIERGIVLDTLSMGMSNDFESAITQGATIVRIGTAIFGPRN